MKLLDKKRIKLKKGEALALNERNMLARVGSQPVCVCLSVCLSVCLASRPLICPLAATLPTPSLLQVNSPFVVNLYYAFQTPDKLCFILDLMNGTSNPSLPSPPSPLPPPLSLLTLDPLPSLPPFPHPPPPLGGDLHYHLTQHGVFSEEEVRFYAAELILALEHIHAKHIVYRDLKVSVCLACYLLSAVELVFNVHTYNECVLCVLSQ